jgi:DNA-directed RNA polymerase specialized sigma24 family protein
VAFGKRARYDLIRPGARPWLYGIATNRVRQQQREEVREALGIPVGTVRSRLNRARRKARAALTATPAKEPANHG